MFLSSYFSFLDQFRQVKDITARSNMGGQKITLRVASCHNRLKGPWTHSLNQLIQDQFGALETGPGGGNQYHDGAYQYQGGHQYDGVPVGFLQCQLQ